MHTITKTSPHHQTTVLGRIAADPSRIMTVRDWWHEMDEPVDMLHDPEATLRDEERAMIELCQDNGIAYRRGSASEDASFPIWLLAATCLQKP